MLDTVVKGVVGIGAGMCASSVMNQVCKAVLPEACTVAEKTVQVVGRIAVGIGVSYAVQAYVDSTVDSAVAFGKFMKQMNKKEDCVVE